MNAPTRTNGKKEDGNSFSDKKLRYPLPAHIEISVDSEGKIWFVSSAPVFEKEKRPNDRLCG